MTTVQDVLDRVTAFDLEFETEEAMNDTAAEFVKKQREQLFSGINEKGEKIQPAYSPKTVAIKKKKGQPFDRVTTRDTGEFHRDIFLDVRDNEFIVDSADSKSEALQKKYGGELMGLSEDNQEVYVEENLDPVFMDRVSKSLEL